MDELKLILLAILKSLIGVSITVFGLAFYANPYIAIVISGIGVFISLFSFINIRESIEQMKADNEEIENEEAEDNNKNK